MPNLLSDYVGYKLDLIILDPFLKSEERLLGALGVHPQWIFALFGQCRAVPSGAALRVIAVAAPSAYLDVDPIQ